MTKPLSPAAQSVKDAVLATYADNVPKDDSLWALERPSTVAALRAAVDEVVPDIGYEASVLDEPVTAELQNVRERFLDIFTELEGTNG